jgi:hypothetical protein
MLPSRGRSSFGRFQSYLIERILPTLVSWRYAGGDWLNGQPSAFSFPFFPHRRYSAHMVE